MKKTSLIILLIIIILAVIGFLAYTTYTGSEQTVTVGSAKFALPQGYHEGSMNPFGATNITNGTNSIFISEYEGNNVSKHIQKYKTDLNKNNNDSFNTTELKIDNKNIYKTTNIKNKATVHYWYVNNDKTYDIYKWDGNNNMDSIVIDLINSMS